MNSQGADWTAKAVGNACGRKLGEVATEVDGYSIAMRIKRVIRWLAIVAFY